VITLSGTRLEPLSRFDGAYGGAPALTDIALSLGRVPRFGGATRRWWTVLQHSLVCYEIARHMGGVYADPFMQLYALMHDAHEAVTGDIPAFWKTPDMGELQDELDARIRFHLGFRKPTAAEKATMKHLDTIALRAEAWVVGPPTITRYIARGGEMPERMVRQMLEEFSTPDHTNGVDSPAAQRFYDVFASLIGKVAPESDHTP
jgi:hypothetical protein